MKQMNMERRQSNQIKWKYHMSKQPNRHRYLGNCTRSKCTKGECSEEVDTSNELSQKVDKEEETYEEVEYGVENSEGVVEYLKASRITSRKWRC